MLNVDVPEIDLVVDPATKLTVEVLGLNTPLLVQPPPRFTCEVVPQVSVPVLFIEQFPVRFSIPVEAPIVKVPSRIKLPDTEWVKVLKPSVAFGLIFKSPLTIKPAPAVLVPDVEMVKLP